MCLWVCGRQQETNPSVEGETKGQSFAFLMKLSGGGVGPESPLTPSRLWVAPAACLLMGAPRKRVAVGINIFTRTYKGK